MALWKYGFMAMKTTIDLPDDLYRQVKAEAALRGRKLKDMVEEGLRLVLADQNGSGGRHAPEPTLLELMEDGIGVFDSGVPDLATNPVYMADYGRDKDDRGDAGDR
jgi:hypothetical protein